MCFKKTFFIGLKNSGSPLSEKALFFRIQSDRDIPDIEIKTTEEMNMFLKFLLILADCDKKRKTEFQKLK